MSIDSPKMLLDLPEGRLYIHPMYNSYTLMNHKEVMQKQDRMGWVIQKLTERVTILEDEKNAGSRATDNEEGVSKTGNDSGATRQGDTGASEAVGGDVRKSETLSNGNSTTEKSSSPAVPAKTKRT